MFTYKKWHMEGNLIQQFQKIKAGKLEPGLVLLYVLPPAGIAWLLLVGLFQLYRVIRYRLSLDFTVTFFLFKFVGFFYSRFHSAS